MKLLKCDMCGQEVDDYLSLSQLYKQFQPNEYIKDVCKPCKVKIDGHLYRLKSLESEFTASALKQWILNKVKKLQHHRGQGDE